MGGVVSIEHALPVALPPVNGRGRVDPNYERSKVSIRALSSFCMEVLQPTKLGGGSIFKVGGGKVNHLLYLPYPHIIDN